MNTKIVLLASVCALSIGATSVLAQDFIFRRTIENSVDRLGSPALPGSPDGENEEEGEEEYVEDGSIALAGMWLNHPMTSIGFDFDYGIRMIGGVAPFTVTLSGNVPPALQDPRRNILYRAGQFGLNQNAYYNEEGYICGTPGNCSGGGGHNFIGATAMATVSGGRDTFGPSCPTSDGFAEAVQALPATDYDQVPPGSHSGGLSGAYQAVINLYNVTTISKCQMSFSPVELAFRLQGALGRHATLVPKTWDFELRVVDARNRSAVLPIRWTVPPVDFPSGIEISVSQVYNESHQFVNIDGVTSVSYASGSATVPGMSFSNGAFVGQPETAGVYEIDVMVSFLDGETGTVPVTVTVLPACDTTPVTLTSPGNYTYSPPPGCSMVQVQAWGAGGWGGECRTGAQVNSCRGGGGGGYSASVLTLDYKRSYRVEVGRGGYRLANAAGGASVFRDGTSSSSTPLVSALGGNGGGGSGSLAGQGGSRGDGVGTTKRSGGNGGTSLEGGTFNAPVLYVGGGGGGAGSLANGSAGGNAKTTAHGSGGNGGSGGGGNGGAGNVTGVAGQTPGGGGGAGYFNGGSGGIGGDGRVIITPME